LQIRGKLSLHSFTDDSEAKEFGDFDVIAALRGWVPERIKLQPEKASLTAKTISTLWVRKRMGSRELSVISNVSTPLTAKGLQSTPVKNPWSTPIYILQRNFIETTKYHINTLCVFYRILDIQDSMDALNKKLFLVRPYYSSGSKQNEFPDQWISEELLCAAFCDVVVYHPTQMYKVTKIITSIVESTKGGDSIRPSYALYVSEEFSSNSSDPGILILMNTFSKFGATSLLGVNTLVCIEEFSIKGSRIDRVPLLRISTNGYHGFFFRPEIGVGYRISFENASSFSMLLYSKEEFHLDDEPKYLTDKLGLKMREFEETCPALSTNAWTILFK
jgi:hypothetical protein